MASNFQNKHDTFGRLTGTRRARFLWASLICHAWCSLLGLSFYLIGARSLALVFTIAIGVIIDIARAYRGLDYGASIGANAASIDKALNDKSYGVEASGSSQTLAMMPALFWVIYCIAFNTTGLVARFHGSYENPFFLAAYQEARWIIPGLPLPTDLGTLSPSEATRLSQFAYMYTLTLVYILVVYAVSFSRLALPLAHDLAWRQQSLIKKRGAGTNDMSTLVGRILFYAFFVAMGLLLDGFIMSARDGFEHTYRTFLNSTHGGPFTSLGMFGIAIGFLPNCYAAIYYCRVRAVTSSAQEAVQTPATQSERIT